MRHSGISVAILTAVLTITTVISGKPHPDQLSKASVRALADRVPEYARSRSQSRTDFNTASKGGTPLDASNTSIQAARTSEIVANDVARTASLCVTDCQTMLNQLTLMLEHEPTFTGKKQVIDATFRRHPQFKTIRIQMPGTGWLTFGSQPDSSCKTQLDQAEAAIQNNHQTFYIGSLSPAGSEYHLALAQPLSVLDEQGRPTAYGVVSADASLEILSRIAKHLDRKFGTSTSILHPTSEVFLGEPRTIQNSTPYGDSQSTVKKTKITGWSVKSQPAPENKRRVRKQEDSLKQTEVAVRFRTQLSETQIKDFEQSSKSHLKVRRDAHRLYVFQTDGDRLAELSAFFFAAGAETVEPHIELKVHEDSSSVQPNDVLYDRYQWNLPQITVDQEWSTSIGSPNVTVAVIDTGVDQNHPEFRGQLVPGYNVLNSNAAPEDDNGHGTHVCGVIAAKTNNLEGVAGIAWQSKIMPIKAMSKDGSGSVVDIVSGIEWAVDHGAQVINLSLGNDQDSDILHKAVQYAASHNVTVVTAMGNDNTDTPNYPAAYPEVISVCAVDSNGNRAPFSNYGPHAFISAPGVSIASTYPDRRYASMSGTSMAAPHISGVVALLKSINPALTTDQIKSVLKDTAIDLGDSGFDPYFGNGLVDANAAASQVKTGSP